MTSIPHMALTGLNASLAQLGAAAHNIANANTQGFQRQEAKATADPAGGVVFTMTQASIAGRSLERDVVSQLVAKNAFMANLAVFRTADDMAGTLLSIHS
jgi:flagellar hook protein FlgE